MGHGPKRNKYSRGAIRAQTSARIALRKAGYHRNADVDFHSRDSKVSSSPEHKTKISSYENQSNYAHDTVTPKIDVSKSGKKSVTPTSERVKQLKRLRRQMGGDRTARGVHDVAIVTKGNKKYEKNDPTNQMRRGRSFKQEVKAVPETLRKIDAQTGDIVSAVPLGTMKGENKKEGGDRRTKIYQKNLGGERDRVSGVMMGRLK